MNLVDVLVSKTILLVEDDRQLQHVLAEALHQAGFTVLAEHDGGWASQTFQSRPVDLVVLDGLLPRKNGFQLAEEIRKSGKGNKLPIIFISGVYKAGRSKKELEDSIGPIEWLDKPLEPRTLIAVVRRLLGIEQEVSEPSDPASRKRQLSRARVQAKLKDLASLADLAEVKSVESESQVRFRGSALVRGNLHERPFTEVLSELHRWRATGALLLLREPVKKLVYVQEGAPIFVRSNLLAETLGQILVRERMITMAECEDALARMVTSKRQQGTELIEMGCISPANLSYALQLQLETKLFDLFGWVDGAFQFNPRGESPPALVNFDMSPARILLEGIKRNYDDLRVRAELGPVESLVVRFSDDPLDRFQDMGLEAGEAQLYALIDGRRTVQELFELTSAGSQPASAPLHPDDARRLLLALKCAGMILLGARTSPGSDAPLRTPAGALRPAPPARKSNLLPPVAELPVRALAEPELLARQQVERLAARAQDLRRGTLFEVLGVLPTASEFEVRNSFAALAKESHPDRLGPEAPREARAFADQIFAQLTFAHDTLSDRRKRDEYESQLRSGVQRTDSEEVANILAAERRFRDGEERLAARDYASARTAFEDAVRLYPDEAEFHACLGWVTWLAAPAPAGAAGSQAQHPALELLEEALALNPRIDRAYLFRGHIYKALGRGGDAEAEFEKALLCNPACAEALSELRLSRHGP